MMCETSIVILYGYLACWLFCTVKNLFDRLPALMFSSDRSANRVKTVSRRYHGFKVLLLKDMPIIAILSSLSLFHSVY